jgi:hypothetical protein
VRHSLHTHHSDTADKLGNKTPEKIWRTKELE